MATVKKKKPTKYLGRIEKRGDTYVFVLVDPQNHRSKPTKPNHYPDA